MWILSLFETRVKNKLNKQKKSFFFHWKEGFQAVAVREGVTSIETKRKTKRPELKLMYLPSLKSFLFLLYFPSTNLSKVLREDLRLIHQKVTFVLHCAKLFWQRYKKFALVNFGCFHQNAFFLQKNTHLQSMVNFWPPKKHFGVFMSFFNRINNVFQTPTVQIYFDKADAIRLTQPCENFV